MNNNNNNNNNNINNNNNNYQVFIDGDNIPIETYFSSVKSRIDEFIGYEAEPIVYCQSNLIFKFHSNRQLNFTLRCCKTSNKNATDARIVLEVGKTIANNQKAIIISNDKIFQEIEDNKNIFVFTTIQYENKSEQLTKKNLFRVFRYLYQTNHNNDVYLSDFLTYFPNKNIHDLREFISFIPQLSISKNDSVYEVKYVQTYKNELVNSESCDDNCSSED